MEFLKVLFGSTRFKALLVTFLVALGAKLGVEAEIIQMACDVAFAGMLLWLGIEVKTAKDKTTPPTT